MSENSPYIVSARKYRPATFKTVVGQGALTSTLKNAINSNRLAQAYLFCGPRGVGKTSCARIFAKTINCTNRSSEGEACGECESCKAIERGNSFNLVELDAASNNSVDDIRAITEQVYVPAQSGNYRVFIIDEVHMLSNSAFNAFLKTLEEPPKNVVFILATTEKHKVIPTILSRCQIYDFKRITVNDMIEHLEFVAREEGVKTQKEALGVIALKADGAMRDALSIFDQVAASTGGNITYDNTVENLNVLDYDYYFRLVDAFAKGDVAESLLIYQEIRDKGFDSQFFINGLASHIRDLMVAADSRTAGLLETSQEVATKYAQQSKLFQPEWYYAALKILSDCDLNYRASNGKRLLVELTLIRLCQLKKNLNHPFESPDHKAPLADPFRGSGAKPEHQMVKTEPQKENKTSKIAAEKPKESDLPDVVPSVRPDKIHTPSSAEMARPSSFRIKDFVTEGSKNQNSLDYKDKTFTLHELNAVWDDFIFKNPGMHILVNAMRKVYPQHYKDNEYIVKVEHPAQKQAFDSAMPALLSFVREKLENDHLILRVEIEEAVSGEGKMLHPREFLRQVINDNPVMAEFLKNIDAELL